jgi:hypothetical protein
MPISLLDFIVCSIDERLILLVDYRNYNLTASSERICDLELLRSYQLFTLNKHNL